MNRSRPKARPHRLRFLLEPTPFWKLSDQSPIGVVRMYQGPFLTLENTPLLVAPLYQSSASARESTESPMTASLLLPSVLEPFTCKASQSNTGFLNLYCMRLSTASMVVLSCSDGMAEQIDE